MADMDAFTLDAELESGVTRRFDGVDGLRALAAIGRYTAPDPAEFRASVTRVAFDFVRVESIAATAHECRRLPDGKDVAADAVVITFVDAGEIAVRRPPAGYRLGAGDASLTRTSAPFAYRAASPVSLIRTIVAIDRMPSHLASEFVEPSGPLPHTPLVVSLCVFVKQLATTPPARSGTEARLVARALSDLQAAVLAEHLGASTEPVGIEALRHRIDEYIDRHLSDPTLSPDTVAAALGVSVRYAHRAFAPSDQTIARAVRVRRLDAVEQFVQHEGGRIRLSELARRFGFSGTEQLTRAFKQRHGMTIDQYFGLSARK